MQSPTRVVLSCGHVEANMDASDVDKALKVIQKMMELVTIVF